MFGVKMCAQINAWRTLIKNSLQVLYEVESAVYGAWVF
jgi:hypothetical protein